MRLNLRIFEAHAEAVNFIYEKSRKIHSIGFKREKAFVFNTEMH